MIGYLTRVSLGKAPGGAHISLRFGITVKQALHQRTDGTSAYFVPNTVFCLAHMPCGIHRAKHCRIDVLRAVSPGEPCSQVQSVSPGAEILLRVVDAAKIEKLLAVIQAIEAQHVRPDAVSPDYWRAVHNRMAANIDPVPFSVAAHAAWVRRRRLSL